MKKPRATAGLVNSEAGDRHRRNRAVYRPRGNMLSTGKNSIRGRISA